LVLTEHLREWRDKSKTRKSNVLAEKVIRLGEFVKA